MTRGLLDDARVERITKTMPLRKVATPRRRAHVVVLASDTLSGHVTGQVVVVAGGMEGRLVHATEEREEACRPSAIISDPADNEKGGVVRRPFSKLQA